MNASPVDREPLALDLHAPAGRHARLLAGPDPVLAVGRDGLDPGALVQGQVDPDAARVDPHA